MAMNTYYHFDGENFSDKLYKIFNDRDISDDAINALLVEVENTVNNVLSFEEEVNSDFDRVECLSDLVNDEFNRLLSNPFLDIYFVNGSFNSVINGEDVDANEVSFNLVEKSNDSFSKLDKDGLGNTAVFVVDVRELSTLFDKRDKNIIKFSNEYMYGYYDQESKTFIKNLNYKSRHTFDSEKDVSYENYVGGLDIPIFSENPLVNELYKKLYSLEYIFSKYVDEDGLKDLINQVKYYASSIVSLKNSITSDMVLDEANLSENFEKEFAM